MSRMRSTRRALLLLVNAVATALTLLTGLRENALVALFTGRFGLVRARLRDARISYAAAGASLEQLPQHTLPSLARVADEYKFHGAPTRSPANLGADRSLCLRVNSMNATAFAVYFDDAFGIGPRREQIFVWSISAPHCDVVNLQSEWLQQQCVQTHGNGNTSACDAFVLAQFDELKRDRSVQVGVPVDFGVVGVPYLRCKSWPADSSFKFLADHLVLQSFWAGGGYQVELQTSVCHAVPAVFTSRKDQVLYRVQAADQQATVAVAVPVPHWIISVVSSIHSAVYLGYLWRGVVSTMTRGSQYVSYFPASTRQAMLGSMADWVPVAAWMTWLNPVIDQTKVYRFHAPAIVAANMWMNQWVYISISIVDACLNIRSVYMMLTMGTWMLTQRVTVENFLFALFTTAKFYSVALVVQLYVMLRLKGSPMISTRAPNPKRPVYGGTPDLTSAWNCEIAIDIVSMVIIQIVVAHVAGTLLLMTKLRRATHNRLLLVLQKRYFFVGWDVFVAMEALNIDSFASAFLDNDGNEVAPTNCSCGALLRQLSSSGPSGWVRLVGEDGLSSSTEDGRNPDSIGVGELRYPIAVAKEMGIYKHRPTPRSQSSISRIPLLSRSSGTASHLGRAGSMLSVRVRQSLRSLQLHTNPGDRARVQPSRLPLTERVLHAHSESTWGSLLLVDFANHPVRLLDTQGSPASDDGDLSNLDDGLSQQVVVRDGLSVLATEERKPLLVGKLLLHIC